MFIIKADVMFKLVLLGVCLSYTITVKSEKVDEKVTLNKSEFDQLVERLTHVEQVANEQSEGQNAKLRELKEEISELKASSRKQELVIARQRDEIKELKNTCGVKSNINSENRGKRQSSEMVVAFSATIKKVRVDNVGLHQNIVFSDVITNIGNSYNHHQGVFVAPVSGLYMFAVTLLSSQNAELTAAIEVNGADVVRMFEKGADNRHGSATQSVIVQLHKARTKLYYPIDLSSDDVSVQSLFGDSGHSYWGDMYTSFSGVLLHEMETGTSQIIGRK